MKEQETAKKTTKATAKKTEKAAAKPAAKKTEKAAAKPAAKKTMKAQTAPAAKAGNFEETFEITVDETELTGIRSVGDVIEYVKKKQQEA